MKFMMERSMFWQEIWEFFKTHPSSTPEKNPEGCRRSWLKLGKLDWFMIEIMSQSMKAGSTEGYYTSHHYTSCLAKHSYQCGDTDTTG